MTDQDAEKRSKRTGQIVGLTIAIAGFLTIIAPWLTVQLGLGVRFEILIYLFALAAMAWAIFVAWGMWQKRHNEQ